ncbi:MAG: phospho-sugar mutase [Bacillaceae bacterium]|nr:phospho-sugar mutase [Bacillaceae bacterium]
MAYRRWLQDENLEPALKQELENLSNKKEIEDRFYRHLAFGTGGLRGVIGAGTNRMNRYTVRRATEGLARYLKKSVPDASHKGVVIAYDSRHMSPEFAQEAACVLAHHRIQTYLFRELRPTPMLSFAVRELGAAGGIVITASHNPPEYNGYKVYGPDGGQIPPATADAILREIEQVENELNVPVLSMEEATDQGLIRFLSEDMDRTYTERLLTLSLNPEAARQEGDQLNIVYTPLHGTGNKPLRRVLKEMGFTRVHVVKEQEQPDPQFSTVSTPNPEERQAFELALKEAERREADLIIGTDPDADRLGIIVKDRTGNYQSLNGNQLGALLLYYLLSQKKKRNHLPQNGVMLKTIVTSELGNRIASSFGVDTVNTLTGFKFIGEKIKEYEQSGAYTFLFGYEESYGYLIGDFVRDKDAIQAGMMVCEMAAYYRTQGQTLVDVLTDIYHQYGYYREDLVSYTFTGREGQEKMQAMMDSLRREPLQQIGQQNVQKALDYKQGIDGLPKANVIKFILDDDSWVAIRPSGTEPKIKLYFSAVAGSDQQAHNKLERMKEAVLKRIKDE